jgi:hypothetical protein
MICTVSVLGVACGRSRPARRIDAALPLRRASPETSYPVQWSRIAGRLKSFQNLPWRAKRLAGALSLLLIGNIPQKSAATITLPLAPRSWTIDGAYVPCISRTMYVTSSRRPSSRNLAELSLWAYGKRGRRAAWKNARQYRLAIEQARCLWDY